MTRFPPMDFSLENASSSTCRFAPKPLFLSWFRAIKAHFQSPPPKIAQKASSRQCYYLRSVLRGGIFVHFTFFFGLYFLLPPFRHFGRWRLLKPLVLQCFCSIVVFKISVWPNRPRTRFLSTSIRFRFFASKTRKKIANTGGK